MRAVTERDPISISDLHAMALRRFGDLVKAVVDLRPSFGNRSRGIDDPETRERIADLVRKLVRR